MEAFIIIMLLLGTVCFAAAAFNVVTPRINLIAAGLLFWILSVLVPALQAALD
jgi:hypothetical protein